MGPTLLDIVKANGNDPLVGLVDETLRAHPELSIVPARTIKGSNYKARVRTALGNLTGSFRNANAGVAAVKHTYEERRVETFILSPRFECDKAVADRSEDGPQVFIATENQGTLEGEMQALSRQFYYGRNAGGNAVGHPGLIDMHDAVNMVVDAGGTTDDTASSVWLIATGPQAVQWVWGENGQFQMSPVRVESLIDPADSTRRFPGYVSDMSAYPGVQNISMMAVVRIKKLTADSGKGLTDTLLAQALSMFPVGMAPDMILANRRSRYQLQISRTPVLNAGPRDRSTVQKMAAVPTEFEGVTIYPTDALLNTEKLAL